MKDLRATLIAVAALICGAIAAHADEITLVAPGGIQAAVQQLIPGFERATGHKVKATFGSGLGTKRQVAAGDPHTRTGRHGYSYGVRF
jgi:molybdate transport system substrate-binding protein